ncbi:MAG: DeoR/GlpR transcriptional regulator [Clostridia bacterium]|nr:DeoR/GlpR transcriptional regulator [Clostridia bacterium]
MLETNIWGDFVQKRRDKINKFIQEKSEATLTQLRALVPGVSEMTIRRDLEALEAEGRIIRVHGGAKSLKSLGTLVEDVFSKRSAINTDKKKLIGEKAAKLVGEGSSIFLDSGSTVIELAKRMPDVPLLITTSGLNIALELLHLENVTVNVLGGEVGRNTIALSGPSAQEAIERLNIDVAFVAATAFSCDSGFTCGNVHDKALKSKVLSKARRKIILMDSTKIGSVMPHTFATVDEVDAVITDGFISEDIKRYFAEKNIEIL